MAAPGLVQGCAGEGGAASSSDTYRYLVGPRPADMQGRDHRFLLHVPASYLPAQLRPKPDGSEPISDVPFVAKLTDFSPAGSGSALAPGVISGTVSWAPEGFVRRRVDGTWLNSFSQYNVPLGERFGLEVRTVAEAQYFPAKLYVELRPERQIMIECAYVPADRPQLCEMWSQVPHAPLVTLAFEEKYLPKWKHLADGAHALISRWALPPK